MEDVERVKFPYKNQILEGTVVRKNKKTVTVKTETHIFRVPYPLLTPKMRPPKAKTNNKQWSQSQTNDYNKSLTTPIDSLPKNSIKVLHIAIKFLAQALREGDDEAINEYANETIAELNRIYKLPHLRVYTSGKRRLTRRGGQYYGLYKTRGEDEKRHSISVYSRTAKTQKYVAPKTFLKTLIHEWAHHYDKYKLKIANTYHTKGFYDRLNVIYSKLKEPLD